MKVIDETNNEANNIKFDIKDTKVRASNDLSENNSIISKIEDSEDNKQSHPSLAALSAQYSDVGSTLFKPTDLMKL